MSKKTIFTVLFVMALLSAPLLSDAAPVVVFPAKIFKATKSGATYYQSFSHSINTAQGVITVVNGDGTDLNPRNCDGLRALQKIRCKVENILRATAVALLRPSSIEVTVNDQVLITSNELPRTAGNFQRSVIVNTTNNLKVTIKGSPLASVTIDIKAESETINQNPIANITATPEGGIAPELIAFSGLGSSDPDGTITSYQWDFGDGSVALGAMPVHTYLNAGNYQTTLTVLDNQGASATKLFSISISQNQPPVAEFVFAVDQTNPLKIDFDASLSSDSDNAIISYQWNFGDSQGSSGRSAEHVYQDYGSYSAQLTVTDSKGGTNSKIILVSLIDNTPLEILSLLPATGAVLEQGLISVQGITNKKISYASIFKPNGEEISLTIDVSGKNFFGDISVNQTGSQIFSVSVRTSANQTASKTIQAMINPSQFWRYAECSSQSTEP